MKIHKYNRMKKLQPGIKGWFWCYKCDANLVSNYAKCGVCGKRNGRYKFKKPGEIPIDL